MARPQTLIELLDDLEPDVRAAFEASIALIRNDVQFAALEAAIRAKDIDAAILAVGVDPSYFRPVDDAIRAAMVAAGDLTFEAIRLAGKAEGVTVRGMFDARNLRAESILREWAGAHVVEIADTTRLALRETLTAALERGTAPRTAALDIVGRANSRGVRTGGTIGLDSTKAEWVRNMADDLRTGNARYFDRKLRDRRFDGLVRRAIEAGKPVSETDVARITDRYSGRLLRLRGEAIARTELLGSLHAAQDESLRQLADSGQIDPDAVTVEWDASNDGDTRPTHRAADGQTRQQGQPFSVGGYAMRFPGDGGLGAPAGEIVNCRCFIRPRVSFVKGLAGRLSPEELASARAAL